MGLSFEGQKQGTASCEAIAADPVNHRVSHRSASRMAEEAPLSSLPTLVPSAVFMEDVREYIKGARGAATGPVPPTRLRWHPLPPAALVQTAQLRMCCGSCGSSTRNTNT